MTAEDSNKRDGLHRTTDHNFAVNQPEKIYTRHEWNLIYKIHAYVR